MVKSNNNILIIGDTIIDENIFLVARGLSLETPTIKTDLLDKSISFGGAANVARFISQYKENVTFFTTMTESHAKQFKNKYNVTLLNKPIQKSNVKQRYWIKHGDSRYKYLQINDTFNNLNHDKKTNHLNEIVDLESYDTIAISDYRCGLINNVLINKVKKSNATTYAASQLSTNSPNYNIYEDIDWIICNKKESKYVNRKSGICITDGSNGCTLNGKHFPTIPANAENTIGAGDCFYAAFIATSDPDYANKMARKFVMTPI